MSSEVIAKHCRQGQIAPIITKVLGFSALTDYRPDIEKICPALEGESGKAYQAFVDTALTGMSQRELLADYKRQAASASQAIVPTVKYKTIYTWSVRFSWQERLKVWRSHLNRLKLEHRLKSWDEFCDKMEAKANALVERADLLMQHPPVEKKVVKKVIAEHAGQEIEQIVIIKPARWTAKDIPTYYNEASQIMKMVVGEVAIAIDLVTKKGYIVSEPPPEDEPES